MNKRTFYKRLAEKYDLPLEYIRFKVNPIYIWNGNKKLSMKVFSMECNRITENTKRKLIQFSFLF